MLRMKLAEGVANRPLLILLMLPIIASSALGGLWPGLLSTTVAAVGIKFLAIPPIHSLSFQHTADLFQWSFLVVNGVLAAMLCELLRNAQAQAERRRLQQEIVQEALRESEAKFRGLFQNIADPVYIADREGRILAANNQACLEMGYTSDEIVKLRIMDLDVQDDTHEKTVARFAELQKVGATTLESRHKRKDGTQFPVEINIRPLVFAGQPCLLGVARDLSERRQAEEALSESEKRFRSMVEGAPDPIFIQTDGKFAFLNLAGCRLFGVAGAHDLIGVPVLERMHPAYHELVLERIRRLNVNRQSVTDIQELRYLRMDGSEVWVETKGEPIVYGGKNGALVFVRDITERRDAREALLESERKIRFALETAGMGGWDLNLQDHTVHRSALHDQIFGYSELLPEWKFEKFLEHVHPEDRSGIEVSLLEAITAASDWNAECRIYRCDGELRWIWFSGRYFLDKHNRAPHIAGFVQDITEGRRSKEHIDHINHVLDAIRLINKVIVYEQDPQTLLQRACNLLIETRGYRTAWAAVYGENGQPTISAESGIGEDFTKLLAAMQDGDKPHCYNLVTKEAAGVVSILDIEEKCAACPLVRRYRDGAALIGALRHNEREYGILAVALPGGMADDENELSLFQELTNDLGYALYSLEQKEKRKQAEDLYSLLFISSTDGILIADTQTKRFRFANPAICALLGYSQEELLSLDVSAIHPQEHLPEIIAVFDSLVRRERTLIEDIPCQRRDGSIVYTDVNAVPIVIEGNNCLAGFFRDITARKQADKEHDKLEKQLLQAQKMESVGQLAGGVAHDYNNMLNVILGYTEMALEGIDINQPLHDELMEVYRAAQRSAEITRQLLAFARKQTIAPVVLDLNDTIGGMLKMLQRLIGENIKLSWNPKSGLWFVKMDPSQIDQILANLCVNARDAIADVGRITIETDNVILDEDYCMDHSGFLPGDYIMLSVSDTGCGMERETLEKIFEPFYTTKEVGKGTGLGMSTVYGIVKQNGGSISVYSEPKIGTTIKIFMPRHHNAEQTFSAKETYTVSKGKGELVLLVEDDSTVRRMGKTMLERAGYAVLAAASPAEAIALAKIHTENIDLLVTDVVMPEMNGKQLADCLLSSNSSLKVLFMSGYTANAIAHHGVLDEGLNFIQKPFSQKELTGKVRAVLDNGSFCASEMA
jgi:PAS domain S-box-containing protein